ncbi:hypothetical protein GCM10009733_022990 [Nonomuraea maheshkhaliensis]|uniref:Uncharacterized protein n=1 Tax=Nonomuraea maheshkhaliensis TaxID=419590 RepID=A0ABN2F132_9ACTN
MFALIHRTRDQRPRAVPSGRAGRLGRRLAAAGAGLALALSVATLPAAAVTEMHVGLSIETFPGPSHDNNTYAVNIDVWLPSNRYDGQGYINNGARVELRVMGRDTWFDNLQMGPYTYRRGPLYADDNGIHLRVRLPATHDQLNEDWGSLDTAGDEIFVRARWVDGAGDTITSESNQVNGVF